MALLLHTTIRCSLTGNATLQTIDNAIGIAGTTRVRVAETLLSAAAGAPIKVWFDDNTLCAQMPNNLVKAFTSLGHSEEQIIAEGLIHGAHQLEARKKSG